MVLKKIVAIFIFMVAVLLSAQVQAEEQKYSAIANIFRNVSDLNQKILLNEDETQLRKLLEEKNSLFASLLLVIRGSYIDYDVNALHKDELQILTSKISINRTRGNVAAVQRDQYKVDDYMLRREIGQFVVFLVESSRDFQSIELVTNEVNGRINKLKKKQKATPKPLQGDSLIYQNVAKNYDHLTKLYATYLDFLEYVNNNPTKIVSTSFLQKLSLISAISYFNNIDMFKGINYAIAPLRIDMGGVIVSLLIVLLNIIAFPMISKGSNLLVERFILDDGKVENMEIVFVSLHKPILYLVLFFGIDLAMNALLYKTEYKASIDHLIYIVYSGLYVYLLFNLIDSVVTAQFYMADKRHKDYSKELILLLGKTLKGLVVLLALTFILSHYGINITAIVSTLGIGGLAFAMAAKDSLSNFFGGLNIMIDRIFKMGDWIKVDSVEGTVVEIGLRSTTIRTFDNALITMPNSLVSTASVLNWNRRSVGRRIKMYVGVTYESNMDDIRQALEDIKQMLADHPDIASPKESHISRQAKNRFLSHEDAHGIKSTQLVFLDRYNDFSIDILIYCFSKTVVWSEWLEVKQDVLFKIAEILEKNNLSFAYPTNVQINRDEADMDAAFDAILSE
ncbi:MAG: MscS family membrane protein [Methyloprofundus sp.]|nr:MAG: MscS family membrane protein [Methyloprofundus sp.]